MRRFLLALALAGLVGCDETAQPNAERETEGRRLRLDTVAGEPDITFVRSKLPEAAFGHSTEEVLARVSRELRTGGFRHPRKLYTAFYGGNDPARSDPKLSGKAKGAYSAIFFRQCKTCTGPKRQPRSLADVRLIWLHESFHSLGAVPAGAPHAKKPHVTDPRTT